IWFDVKLWTQALSFASEKLSEWKPEWKEEIQKNTDSYLQKLAQLDREAEMKVSELKSKNQVLVTAHDAFAYFGKSYGMEVHALQGLSTLSEPGLRDLTELIQLIERYQVKAIFAEQTISPKAIQAVANGVRENNRTVKLAGPLYTDSLDAPGTPAGTYLGMFETNLNTIYQNLIP
ncbi:MAG: metal ion ABC transporter substrate-binding protein, partial [Cytophagales bacterium]